MSPVYPNTAGTEPARHSQSRGDTVILQIFGATLTCMILVSIVLWIVQLIRTRISARTEMELTLELLREEFAAAARIRVGRQAEQPAWLGFRSFLVERKIKDGPSSDSFWLVPQDGRPLPTFQPGQYLTVRVRMAGQVPDQKEIVERRYPITNDPNEQFYCISVERLPDMMLSGCLHQGITAGTVVDVLAPRGKLGLDDVPQTRPVVLVADGVGTRPCISMLETAADANLDRPVTVIYGVRHGHDHGIAERLGQLAGRMPNLRIVAVESDPNSDDSMASCRLDFGGSVSIAAVRDALPSNNFNFQLWGPAPMVESLTSALSNWHVPEQRIRTEAFGAPLAPALVNLIGELPRVSGTTVAASIGAMTWRPERTAAEEEPDNTYSRVLKNPALAATKRDSKTRRGSTKRGRVASS